jgi:dihydropteroate synthase
MMPVMRTPQVLALPSGALLDLTGAPQVMAVVNCTDDSFYAPSRAQAEAAVERALQAVVDGASLVDFGGESSRPGAAYVDAAEEMERIVPVVAAFRRRSAAAISVDTRKAAVARAALDSGADIINDISALGDDPDLASLCAERGAPVVLMHKQGVPATMQAAPVYGDVLAEVASFLTAAADNAIRAGIPAERIILDPGIGFGKRLEDNLDLIARLEEIVALGYPVLVGLSRKSFIGMVTGRDAGERLPGTLAANAAAILGGAKIIRVHDVRPNVDAVKVLYALEQRRGR